MATSVAAVIMLGTEVSHGQTVAAEALVKLLRQGGYVLVMRHASSPREVPDKQAANADNVKLERQLDEAGRAGAAAMGKALRDLKIPIGSVLTSPTYRAVETVRLADREPAAQVCGRPPQRDLKRRRSQVAHRKSAPTFDFPNRSHRGSCDVFAIGSRD
jgi:hypothetical protein